MKYDMDDLAVLIPVRVESLVRLENLLSVVRYLQTHFSLDIKVWEADAFNNQFLERLLPPDVEYKFNKTKTPYFTGLGISMTWLLIRKRNLWRYGMPMLSSL